MRIVVVGTGGVGGYFGARLALAGNDVTFIARGAHLHAMRENGLRVMSPLGDMHLPKPHVTESPAEAGKADLIILGVKLWGTVAAIHSIKPLVDQGAAVISFQNGVQKDELLRAFLGDEAILGGACYIASTIDAPGQIRHTGTMAKLVFGEFDGHPSERVKTFLDTCIKAGIEATISPKIHRTLWEKFVFLVGLSGTTTIIRKPIGAIRSNLRTRAFLLDAMGEVVSVGRAQGVDLEEGFAERQLAFCDGLPAEMTSSMHKDLDRGNPLEVQWLSGDVVERGEATGIPTPVNRAILDALTLHANGSSRESGESSGYREIRGSDANRTLA